MPLDKYHSHFRNSIKQGPRALVIGAGPLGETLVNKAASNLNPKINPVGFIDVDGGNPGQKICGLPVLGNLQDLTEVAQTSEIELAIVALPHPSGQTIQEIVGICQRAGLPLCMLSGIGSSNNAGRGEAIRLREIDMEDLLRGEPLRIDHGGLHRAIERRRILVTGAGGSIGAELCRQIAQYNPAELVLLGHGEHSIFTLASELARSHPAQPTTRVIADVRDENRLHKVFASYQPEIIFHAAAHKHVTLMEENIEEAVTNNVLGTLNVIKAAQANEVGNLIFVSTDKAVNPTNVMGATKRIAELLVCQAAEQTGSRYVSVRFGNVLGSRGSVLSIFRKQIADGGPITVTHPEMCRYFMTIQEAVHLVLQAMLLGKGGEIFVFDMGEPLKIADLARNLIELSGLELDRDISIEYTGVGPGEKLFEELFLLCDSYESTEHHKIFVSRNGPRRPSADKTTLSSSSASLDRQIETLLEATRLSDRDLILQQIKDIVPEYRMNGMVTHDAAVSA